MPGRRIKVNRPISLILTLKLVAMATSLERSEKEGQILDLRWGAENGGPEYAGPENAGPNVST